MGWTYDDLLDLPADVLLPAADTVDTGEFPDHWTAGELELPVSYVFEPGSGHDGVTVSIELAQLNRVSADDFSWQIPGLRGELVTELVRGLPKQWRAKLRLRRRKGPSPATSPRKRAARSLRKKVPTRRRPRRTTRNKRPGYAKGPPVLVSAGLFAVSIRPLANLS